MDIKYELANSPLLNAVFKSLPEMVFVVDRERKILGINDAVKNLMRKDTGDILDLRAGDALNCIHSRDTKEGCGFGPACSSCVIRQSFNEVLEKGIPLYNRESVIDITLNGKVSKLNVLINTVPFALNSTSLAVLTISDITTIKELERQKTAGLERLSMIGSAAAAIIHDLKSPLTSAKGFLYLMESADNKEEQQRFMSKVGTELDKILKMNNEILAFASGRDEMSVEREEVALADFVEQAVAATQSHAPINIGATTAATINIDATKIGQVLWNLIKNANEALYEVKNRRINISAEEIGDAVIISVNDNGPGISANIADRLFKPGQTYGKRNGKGFGLFGARRTVEAHGGRLWFETEPGKGTTFFIKLPKK